MSFSTNELKTQEREAPSEAAEDERRFVVGERLERSTAESLYAHLYRKSSQRSRVDFEAFLAKMETERSLIQERTGCTNVQFRVALENGKRRLKAKPAPIA